MSNTKVAGAGGTGPAGGHVVEALRAAGADAGEREPREGGSR